MLLALVDQLRCTEEHADTWLVARADRVEDGRMVTGVLGCPVCRLEREVRGGVVHWTPDAIARPAGTGHAAPDRDAVLRIGALVGFGDSGSPFVLCGAVAGVATGLAALADAPLVLLDPPDDTAARIATIIRGAPRAPLAAGSARAIAFGADRADVGLVSSAVAILAPSGRMVAPAGTSVPTGIRELARDATHWVGEREAAVVPLARAPRRQ